MKIFLELFLGILLWMAMLIGNKMIHAMAHRSSRVRQIMPYLPGSAFAVWILYAFWLLQRWFAATSIYPMVLFLLIALLAILFVWFILRDIIAGIVVSGRRQLHINHRIRLNDMSGKIIERRMTHATIRTNDGDLARIPYSRMSGEVFPERSEETGSDYHSIHLSIPKTDTPEQLQAVLARNVLSIPWASAGTAPIVRLQEQTDSDCKFEILIRSLNSRHAARVEHILRGIYENRE
jgi:small-conductance mechanosensitive channel